MVRRLSYQLSNKEYLVIQEVRKIRRVTSAQSFEVYLLTYLLNIQNGLILRNTS